MSPRSGGIWRATRWRHAINPAGPNAPRALFYSRVSLLRHRNSSLLHASRDFQDGFVCLRLLPPCATNRLKLWLCIKFTFFVISICSGHQLAWCTCRELAIAMNVRLDMSLSACLQTRVQQPGCPCPSSAMSSQKHCKMVIFMSCVPAVDTDTQADSQWFFPLRLSVD